MTNALEHLGRLLAVGSCLALIGASISLGQTATNSTEQYVSPIDQGVSDISPLSASLIHNAVDLRAVRQFDLVYPVPGRPDMLMRQSGALSAVFPYSDYKMTNEGSVAVLIPAGTVFYIGPATGKVVPSFYSSVRPPRAAGIAPMTTQRVTQPVSRVVRKAARITQHATIPASSTLIHAAVRREQVHRASRLITISDEKYRRYRLRMIARELSSTG